MSGKKETMTDETVIEENEIQESEILDDETSTEEVDGVESKELTPEDNIILLEVEVEKLKEENSTLKDQYLRKHADFENFRRRMNKEKQDSIQYGNQGLLKDLIEVIDNFERAIKSSEDSQDIESFREGISMIEQQFTNMLKNNWGLEKIEAVGKEFDANQHEALMMEDSEEHEVNTVLEDFQTGYKLRDRVLRPSKVKVAKPLVKD